MKKLFTTIQTRLFLLALIAALFFGNSTIKAQCGGSVNLDQTVDPGAAVSSFDITTTYPNELILIEYDGFQRFTYATGPVTVDGNPATFINRSYGGGYTGAASVYAYPAATPGVHSIVCDESGWFITYYINAASSFYATGYNTVLNLSSITSSSVSGSCSCYDASITTINTNSMIYTTAEINNGVYGNFPFTWTGATELTDEHQLDGIQCATAYTSAPTAGSYTVTANNGHAYVSIPGADIVMVAIENTGLTPVVSVVTPVTCGPNGSVAITFVSGTAPYTYLWSNSATTDTISGLSVGTYTVTVTDNNGCSGTGSVTLVNPSPIVATLTTDIQPTNCLSNGELGVTVSGGTSPYTYSWSNGATTALDSGIVAGGYTLTVTDNCSNTVTDFYTLSTSGLDVSAFVISNASCSSADDGSAAVSINGGTPPFTYSWSNGATTDTASALSSGYYTVTVTDNGGCVGTRTVHVGGPSRMFTYFDVYQDPSNCDSNGELAVYVSGGSGPYTYHWSNGATTDTISNLPPLNFAFYSVTVTDACGSVSTDYAYLFSSGLAFNVNILSTATCNGGSADIVTSSYDPPYTYYWSDGETTDTATHILGGFQYVTVTSGNGCTGTQYFYMPGTGTPYSYFNVYKQPSNCDSNGQLAVYAYNGTPPYTYLWSPGGQTTDTISNLPPVSMNYCCTITDACGNTSRDCTYLFSAGLSFTVNQLTLANCSGGSADITTSSYDPPYTYLWSDGETTDTALHLPGGSDYVTVTSGAGCTGTKYFYMNGSGPTYAYFSIVNPPCYGDSNGALGVYAYSGTPPFTYLWNNSNTNSEITGLSAGNYTVTVTDNCGSQDVLTYYLNQNSQILVATSVTQNANCNQLGCAMASVSGGAGFEYTFDWLDSNNTVVYSSFSFFGNSSSDCGLTAGNYTVMVTDYYGCSGTAGFTITQPPTLTDSAFAVSNILCNGQTNGIASVNVAGGTTPYTYLWSNGGTTNTISGLSIGTYTINVNDNNNCVATSMVTITQPLILSDSIVQSAVVNLNCFSSMDGSLTVGVLGGTQPYTYTWSPNVGNTATVSSLSAGTYSVTVTDKNGCSASTVSMTITEPPFFMDSIVSGSIVNVVCKYDSTGSITVGARGGIPPYTYIWTPNVSSSATASDLSAGTYSVTVEDSHGCIASLNTVTITQPIYRLKDSVAVLNNVGCLGGNEAWISIGTRGGVPPYTYVWTPNVSSIYTASGLSAGTYSVSITDNVGCNQNLSVTVTQPSATLVDTVTSSASPLCYGGMGSATIGVAGGTPAYTYQWIPNVSSSSSATNLVAGTYSVIVSDAHGCMATCTVTITQTPAIVDSVVQSATVNELCNGGSIGSATIGVTGGTSPYTYNWSPNVSSSATATGLSAGTYSVSVTDNNGCTSTTALVTITQPAALNDNVMILANVGCNGGSGGSASANVSGGTGPYTYLWAPGGQTTYNVSGLTAGTYTITVTDMNSCSTSNTVTITQPTMLVDTVTSTTNTLCNGSNGSATIGVTGGTPAYMYQWNPNVSTSATATGLAAGTYTVTVSDSHGCNASVIVTVNQTAATIRDSIVQASTVNILCNGGSNGSATVGVLGGSSPYTYTWSPNVSSSATATGLSAGSYSVTITDNNGCSGATVVATITQPAVLGNTVAVLSNVGCNGGTGGSASIYVTGGTGPYIYSWTPSVSTTYTASGLSAGTYSIAVTDNNGCTTSGSVTVTQPAMLADTVTSITNLVCQGLFSSATVGATGGTTPYHFLWAPNGATGSTCSTLTVGTYTVTVMDTNSCSATCTVVIAQPSAIHDSVVQALTVNIGCNGGSNGSATIGVSGGVAPYTYTWAPNTCSTATATGLSAGTYSVFVLDNKSCNGNVVLVTITQPMPLRDSAAVVMNPGCNGGNQGSISVGTRGGTQPYTYTWSPNVSTVYQASGLSAGTYSITVTDKNGCSASSTLSITITQPASALTLTLTSSTYPVCYGGDGTASFTAAGGTAPYTYQWTSAVSTASSATALPANYYTCEVTDAHGCNATASVTITQPAQIIVNTIYVDVTNHCNGIAGVSSVVGGTPPYTYLWSPGGQTTDSITNQCTGDYCIKVTDHNGCIGNNCVTIGATVGIQTLSNSSSITIYPDPNNGQFTVSGVTEGQIIQLYNSIGQNLSTVVVDKTTMLYDISDKANGVYLIRIMDKDGHVLGQKKMVKTR